jgi:LysR family transcriptional regulator, glycine cleavage system transcriptional activator
MSVSPPRSKGPPLNALRAFEAASRTGGFKAAAAELNVTAGAIAQQIKSLEAWVGGALFKRHAQGVTLTREGKSVSVELTGTFDQLAGISNKLRMLNNPDHIRIAALPSIAQLWLSPRLPAIRSAVPDAKISVTAMEVPPNMVRDGIDFSIFFSDQMKGPDCHSIAEDIIFPVCAPQLKGRLQKLDDFSSFECLGDANWVDDWGLWLEKAGKEANYLLPGQIYSLYSLALEEAKNGAGLVMGHALLVDRLLKQGSLVRAHNINASTGRHLMIKSQKAEFSSDAFDVVKALLFS